MYNFLNPFSALATSEAFNSPGEGLFDSPSNFKATKAIEMKLYPEVDNYEKF